MSQKLPARNRVIYQSEALFISPDATGYHYTGASGLETIEGVGDGPFGLMTPALSGRQTIGGSISDPAKNNNGQAVGWQEGDAWPVWNPTNAAGAKAEFDGKVVKSDATENVTIISNSPNAATINGDGVKTLATLLGTAHNLTVGDPTLIPDSTAVINIAGGTAESKASHTMGYVCSPSMGATPHLICQSTYISYVYKVTCSDLFRLMRYC